MLGMLTQLIAFITLKDNPKHHVPKVRGKLYKSSISTLGPDGLTKFVSLVKAIANHEILVMNYFLTQFDPDFQKPLICRSKNLESQFQFEVEIFFLSPSCLEKTISLMETLRALYAKQKNAGWPNFLDIGSRHKMMAKFGWSNSIIMLLFLTSWYEHEWRGPSNIGGFDKSNNTRSTCLIHNHQTCDSFLSIKDEHGKAIDVLESVGHKLLNLSLVISCRNHSLLSPLT